MKKTPEKNVSGHDMDVTMTPDNKPPLDGLTESMSFLRIQPPHQPSGEEDEYYEEDDEIVPLSSRGKRSYSNRASVEGSPFIRNDKRLDIHPTPNKAVMDFLDVKDELTVVPGTAVVAMEVLPTPPNSTEKFSATSAGKKSTGKKNAKAVEASSASVAVTAAQPVVQASNVKPITSVKTTPISKLFVVCSKSDDHNTGCHQENARRTALLCGPEGCLRRPALHNDIEWFDSDQLDVPPLTDLLRVHEYEYIRHLEHKCDTNRPYEGIPPFYAPSGQLDTDTPLVDKSLDAAKRFCRFVLCVLMIIFDCVLTLFLCFSAAIIAVDRVMQDHIHAKLSSDPTAAVPCNRAFVIGRPPGHHAGSNG